ncbi:hypothetical protein [Qingshengfaniella alkalisoli]|uniref:Uncharacterized protein n=1 Tax=Qingshengfaniella alkalisoli TaxID=2599296 RepID=A0A5B8IX23_9RHOB|nr:hypothetical protein [Qingshengfaniella alkalisoli]QDY70133.1 hypothetical protein FPZ52_11205 [Qingshengfaniella alkalisoli]
MPSYARETIELRSLAPDLIPEDAPLNAWNNGANVLFKNGESIRSRGDKATLTGAEVTPRTAVYVEPFDQGYWVYATDAGIFVHDGTNEFDITPVSWGTPTANSVWTSDVINGLAVINCSSMDPVYWDGMTGNPCEPLPDWPAGGRCLAMRAHKNFLFAIGMVSEGDQRVRWSDAAEAGIIPQEWTPSASNLAGFVDLAPLSSPCIDGKTLHDSMLIYKRASVWSLDFVGGNTVFTARKLFANVGILGANAVTSGPDDVHLFAGSSGDIYLTDGAQVRSVLDGRAQRTFYEDFSAAGDLVFSAVTLHREKMGFIIYPGAGDSMGTRAIAYDFASGDIGMRDMPGVTCAAEGQELQDVGALNEWDGDPGVWNDDDTGWNHVIAAETVDDCLIGGDFGFRVLEGGDTGASTVAARLEKSGLSFGDAQRRKMIRAIWPKVRGREGDIVTFRVGGQERSGGAMRWADPVAFAIGSDDPVEVFVQGRYMVLEVTSDGGEPWRMGTIDVEYRGAGTW